MTDSSIGPGKKAFQTLRDMWEAKATGEEPIPETKKTTTPSTHINIKANPPPRPGGIRKAGVNPQQTLQKSNLAQNSEQLEKRQQQPIQQNPPWAKKVQHHPPQGKRGQSRAIVKIGNLRMTGLKRTQGVRDFKAEPQIQRDIQEVLKGKEQGAEIRTAEKTEISTEKRVMPEEVPTTGGFTLSFKAQHAKDEIGSTEAVFKGQVDKLKEKRPDWPHQGFSLRRHKQGKTVFEALQKAGAIKKKDMKFLSEGWEPLSKSAEWLDGELSKLKELPSDEAKIRQLCKLFRSPEMKTHMDNMNVLASKYLEANGILTEAEKKKKGLDICRHFSKHNKLLPITNTFAVPFQRTARYPILLDSLSKEITENPDLKAEVDEAAKAIRDIMIELNKSL